MKLWLLQRLDGYGYDEFDAAIVVAETAEEARLIHPGTDDDWTRPGSSTRTWECPWTGHLPWPSFDAATGAWRRLDRQSPDDSWAAPDDLTVSLVGVAEEHLAVGTVLCASFNAG